MLRPRLYILAALLLLTGCQLTPRQQTQIAGDALVATGNEINRLREARMIGAADYLVAADALEIAAAAWKEMDRTADDGGAAFAFSPWAKAFEKWAAAQAKALDIRRRAKDSPATSTTLPVAPTPDELPPRPGE